MKSINDRWTNCKHLQEVWQTIRIGVYKLVGAYIVVTSSRIWPRFSIYVIRRSARTMVYARQPWPQVPVYRQHGFWVDVSRFRPLFPENTPKNFRWLKILRILLKSSVCIAKIVNSQPVTVAGGGHMGNAGLKNLYPDTIRYPLKKSKRTDNIIDFVHAIMWRETK